MELADGTKPGGGPGVYDGFTNLDWLLTNGSEVPCERQGAGASTTDWSDTCKKNMMPWMFRFAGNLQT